MENLPKAVITVKTSLSRDPEHDLHDIAAKLISDDPDLEKMWKSLEKKHTGDADPTEWVWKFLYSAAAASNLPRFHYKSVGEREELSETIDTLSRQLARTLEANGLDAHLIYDEGEDLSGFFFFEDFGYSNQALINLSGKKKLKASVVIKTISKRATQQITVEPSPGKAGKNVQAIRFIRIVADRNLQRYGQPLNAVVAAAANALFKTSYNASDIRNLLSR